MPAVGNVVFWSRIVLQISDLKQKKTSELVLHPVECKVLLQGEEDT